MYRNIQTGGLMAWFLLMFNASALAYVDPQTTHSVITGTIPILSVLAVIINLVLWPFIFLRKRRFAWFRRLSVKGKTVFALTVVFAFLVAVIIPVYKLFW